MNEIILNNQTLPIVIDAGFTEKLYDITDRIYRSEHRPGHHIMLYATGDALSIYEDGTDYVLKSGDVIFLNTDLDIHINISGRPDICLYYFFFYMSREKETGKDKEAFPELLKSYTLPKVLEGISGSVLDIKLHDYPGYFQNPNELAALGINTAFYDILCECVRLNREYHSFQNNLSDEIIEYLKEYSNQPLNTRDMEKRFYLTYKYMGTAFKKSTGSTILRYHTGLRMKQARRLLITTFYSIDEISRQLGYSDALYFSRVFKKYYGQSPQIYRKTHRKT